MARRAAGRGESNNFPAEAGEREGEGGIDFAKCFGAKNPTENGEMVALCGAPSPEFESNLTSQCH